jgi:hypothetical protein
MADFFKRLDFRKEMEFLRDSLGFAWAALRSQRLDEKCIECTKSVGAQYDQPNPSCKTCMGTGHPYVDKIVKVYRTLVTPGFDYLAEVGNINTTTSICYMEHDANPKEGDYILELELNETTMTPIQPFNVIRANRIQDSHDNRGIGGRIEYWACRLEEKNFDIGKSILSL